MNRICSTPKLSTGLEDRDMNIPRCNTNESPKKSVEPQSDEISKIEGPSELENDIASVKETTAELSVIQMNDDDTTRPNGSELTMDAVNNERELFKNQFVEVGRRLWPSSVSKQHYTKGCLWSPDGTCILVPVHLDGMHVIELPTDLYTASAVSPTRTLSRLESAVHVKEGGTNYDCVWYPFMNSSQPETCCWLGSRQHEPIHMWDAFNGELRCSYRGYDDVDEVETAISIAFSNDGKKIFGGYKKNIKTFDTAIPGRDCCTFPVKQAVSCFAMTTENDNTITTGSWNGLINHYDLRSPKIGALFTLRGHTGGITYLRYRPSETHWSLFSGARKDNFILEWDMRNYSEPVRKYERIVDTNQRIYFDFTPQQKWLLSGDTKGFLHTWDLHGDEDETEVQLHYDCTNGVSVHPFLPIIASSSGQYHFYEETEAEEPNRSNKFVDYENSLLLLWFGNVTDDSEI